MMVGSHSGAAFRVHEKSVTGGSSAAPGGRPAACPDRSGGPRLEGSRLIPPLRRPMTCSYARIARAQDVSEIVVYLRPNRSRQGATRVLRTAHPIDPETDYGGRAVGQSGNPGRLEDLLSWKTHFQRLASHAHAAHGPVQGPKQLRDRDWFAWWCPRCVLNHCAFLRGSRNL